MSGGGNPRTAGSGGDSRTATDPGVLSWGSDRGVETEQHQILVEAVRLRLARSGDEPTPSRVAAALRAEGRLLGDRAVLAVVSALRSEMVGAGPLQELLAEPRVTDVLVNGPADVWVDRGNGLERTGVSFADVESVRRLAQRLAMAAGRRLDDAQPWVDARLPDGTRLHAVLPPVAVGSPCLSLRVTRRRAFTLDELVSAGTVTSEGAALLRAVVDARLSFLVSGGTGSGKTTLLSALLGLVQPDERIVVAEESAELYPDHPHVVRLEARPANQEGTGQVTLRDLVRHSLRMRPDRLVVGEVRGPEVAQLLEALNTGHDGGCGTVHANAAGDVPTRLEALGLAAGLDRLALHSQLGAALAAVVHVVRERGGRRRVAEVHVLDRTPQGLVVTVPAVVMRPDETFDRQRGWPKLEGLCRRGTTTGQTLPAVHGSGTVLPPTAAPRAADPLGSVGRAGGARREVASGVDRPSGVRCLTAAPLVRSRGGVR